MMLNRLMFKKTGDENDMFLWLAVMALMACAGAALRKKEE